MQSLYDMRADSVPRKYAVVGQKRERLGNALRDQQTVKRISMNRWKPGDAGRVRRCYWQLDQTHVRQRRQQGREVDAEIFASEPGSGSRLWEFSRAKGDLSRPWQ